MWKQRESAVGVSACEAAGEVVPERWAEPRVSRNGGPPLSGQDVFASMSAGEIPNSGGTTDILFALSLLAQGVFSLHSYLDTERKPQKNSNPSGLLLIAHDSESIINDSHTLMRCTIIILTDLDAGLGVTCMDNLSAADIKSHMVDGS